MRAHPRLGLTRESVDYGNVLRIDGEIERWGNRDHKVRIELEVFIHIDIMNGAMGSSCVPSPGVIPSPDSDTHVVWSHQKHKIGGRRANYPFHFFQLRQGFLVEIIFVDPKQLPAVSVT